MAKIYDVAVIGAGHNGLIAASYLAKAGFSVGVFERRNRPGGSAVNRVMENGFTFFEGAHVLSGFNPAVIRQLGLVRHGLEIIPILGRATFTEQGHALAILRNERENAAQIRRHSELDAEAFHLFVSDLEKQQRMLSSVHENISVLSGSERRGSRQRLDRQLKILQEFGEDALYGMSQFWLSSCAEYLDRFFEMDALKTHLAGTAFIGMPKGPMSSATAYLLLRHELNRAVSGVRGYVRGGMGRLIDALEKSALHAGCELHCNAQVVEITSKRNKVNGLVLNDGTIVQAQNVISNLDFKNTFLSMFDWDGLPNQVKMDARNHRTSGSIAKMNIALGGIPHFPALEENVALQGGHLQFTSSLQGMERAFDDWKDQAFPKRPYIEGIFPTVFDPELAPEGKHLFSLYLQYIPKTLLSGEWSETQKFELAKLVIAAIGKHSPDFSDLILDWSITLPGELEDRFFLDEGDIYHGEMNLEHVLFRPTRFHRKNMNTGVSGLYVCGSAADIEGGLTGDAGLSAAQQVVAEAKGMDLEYAVE